MRKVLIIILSVFILIILCIFFMRYRENMQYEAKGQELINKIESFQRVNNKLPENLEDLGEEESMSIGPYYEKIDEHRYKVYFCIDFDIYKTYNSDTKEWTQGYR